jgi:ribosomal protein S1
MKYMTNNLEDFDLIYSEESFKKRKKTKDYMKLLELYDSSKVSTVNKGDIVNAVYEGLYSDYYIFSVDGLKDNIRIDFKPSESKYLKEFKIGDSTDIFISDVNEVNFFIKGSLVDLYETRAHANLKAISESHSVVAFIKEINPAGYSVDILYNSVILPGFMPNTLAGINKLYNPESIVGSNIEVMIESFSEQEGTYIVSRRKYLETLIPDEIKKLKYDSVYTGNVTGTTPFGVFVEFNECLTGMIHKANINQVWAEKLDQIPAGTEIDFYIKEILKEKGKYKIILTQILRETLWDTIQINQVIEGKVKSVKPFGTLVLLDEETIGLIHNSEIEKSKQKIVEGQTIKIKAISIDRSNRKIFLSLV